jgi:hypothetical protein
MSKKIEIKRDGIFILVDIKNGNRIELYKATSLRDIEAYITLKGVI